MVCNKVTQQHKAKGRAEAPPASYPPGYFTAKLWPHARWPHAGWVPQLGSREQIKRDAWHSALAINSTVGVVAGKAKTVVLDGSTSRTAMALPMDSAAYALLQRLMTQRAQGAGKRGAK
jgi:hypothetical protein